MKKHRLDMKVTVVGGPFPQKVDPVLRLVPTGKGRLAAKIADELGKHFISVERIGNFHGGVRCSFQELQEKMSSLETNVLVFLPHLPNIIIEESSAKIRVEENEKGSICYSRAPKIVESVKGINPEMLLVPFKLADQDTLQIEIVKWMLDVHSALAVYSRLGDSENYFIIDALGNEVKVSKSDLPRILSLNIINFVRATRRRTVKIGEKIPEIEHVDVLVNFSKKMRPAFEQILGVRNVKTDRWPGNFSFRCTHSFLSSRLGDGFIVTKRNVDKTGLTENDFVFVSLELKDGALQFCGKGDIKPSIDSPVHRIIYEKLSWVNSIVHGHLHVEGDCVRKVMLDRWPCGAENEGEDVISAAPKDDPPELFVMNVDGHGFVALIKDKDPASALDKLSKLEFKR